MKTSIKRIICLLFAVCILVCAFSACGNKDKTGSESGNKTSSTDVIVSANQASYGDEWIGFDPYASIPDSIKGQTVRYATWIDHWNTEGKKPLENFEKDTGLKCELFTVSSDGYVDKLISSITSGDVPDVFKSNEKTQNFPLTLQVAAPINKVSTVNLDEPIWDQSMIKTATIDGNVYLLNTIGSPWSGSNLVYYNKAIFEDNGFTTPEEYYEDGNWTWATMLKAMKDVASLGSDYLGGSIDPEVLGDSAGVSFVMYDYKTATFSSGVNKKELIATYQWFADAKEQGLVQASGVAAFNQGKCGLCITGVYGLKNTGHFKDMDPEDIGYTYLPALEEGTYGRTSSIYRMYGIVDGAPNANAAGYFIRYWLDPKNYDLQNTFVSPEAGQFYYALINKSADEKYFNYDDAVGTLVGGTGSGVFISGAKNAYSAQVPTKIAAVSNVVDQAVIQANKLVQALIEKNR